MDVCVVRLGKLVPYCRIGNSVTCVPRCFAIVRPLGKCLPCVLNCIDLANCPALPVLQAVVGYCNLADARRSAQVRFISFSFTYGSTIPTLPVVNSISLTDGAMYVTLTPPQRALSNVAHVDSHAQLSSLRVPRALLRPSGSDSLFLEAASHCLMECPFLRRNRHCKIVSCPQSNCGIAGHFAPRCLFTTGDPHPWLEACGAPIRHCPVARSQPTLGLIASAHGGRTGMIASLQVRNARHGEISE